jgi:RND family efflux transporter MFP subunit
MPLLSRLIALALVLFVSACGQGQPPAAPPPPTVTISLPKSSTIVDRDEYVGRFVAMNSVEVRARVSGYLEGVHFKDGQIVKEGDILFSIDKRPFQNSLDQARANLQQARSSLAYTDADLARGQQLVRDKTITEQTFDQRVQAQKGAAASVAANEALVRQAELDLQFTEPKAPITGRIGDRRVSPGNLVTGGTAGAGTTLLATIVSTDPIWLEFTFDEASYLRYERITKKGDDIANRGGGAEIMLKLIDESDFTHKGRMDFVDNAIDRATGTIRARATLANPDGLFTPGGFARIQVPGSAPYSALLVPDAAIGSEQVRKFLYVVKDDNTVVQKFVTLGQLSGNMRVIKTGLEANERVIVDGLMRARPGQKVTPQEQGAAPAGAPAPETKK